MRNVEQLNNFLSRVTSDVNLTTTHVGVCAALVAIWMSNGLTENFRISRKQLMDAAKVKSTSTYHRIIADLISLKYINYNSSYHPTQASTISIL
jgi:hypothetical protein